MKRIFTSIVVIVSTLLTYAQSYGGGNGSANDPFILKTPSHLSYLSNTPSEWSMNYSFVLEDDIDMDGVTFTPIGSTEQVFTGDVNGKKHTISNLNISTPGIDLDNEKTLGVGLFGALNGNVSNLGIINISFQGDGFSRTGAIAGVLDGGSITQCYSEGGTLDVGSGGWTGGIVGALFSGGNKTVEDCYSSSNIIGNWGIGGIVGVNRGEHSINRVAFYGSVSSGNAIVTIQNDADDNNKNGIAPSNAFFATSTAAIDANATELNASQLSDENSYTTFDFIETWHISESENYAVLNPIYKEPEMDFFETIRTQRIASSDKVEWTQFGPGMSGYNEEFWCHPTDVNTMFMGPDMHVTYGTWDNGESWYTIKDQDGLGIDLERTLDIKFSLQNLDYGVALERRGWVYTTQDRGRNWTQVSTLPKTIDNTYNMHTKIAIHPEDDQTWFIGAGGFWDIKNNHRSAEKPQGTQSSSASYGYILKTTDAGASWTKIATDISDDLDVGRIIISPIDPDIMIIATGQGMYRSTDGGTTWISSASGLPNNRPRDLCMYYDGNNEFILYCIEQTFFEDKGNTVECKGGVYKSTDNGNTWQNISGNIAIDMTQITSSTELNFFHKTVGNWFGISSSDSEAKYTDYPSIAFPTYNRIVVNPLDKNEIYICHNKKHDKSFGPGELWKTTDGGLNWITCARDGSYWINDTNKSYWESRNNPTGANIKYAHLQREMDHSSATSGNRMLAINADGEVFIGIDQQTLRSNDHGESWEQVDDYETEEGSKAWIGRGDSNLPGRFILHETGIPDRKLLCSGEHGLWKTVDNGDWLDKEAVAVTQIEGQVHDGGAHSISTVAVHPNDPNTIYILSWRQSHRGKLRRTTDGGATWENIATIFEASNDSWEGLAIQYSLVIDPVNPDNMYFCSIKKTLSEVGSSVDEDVLTKGGYGVYSSTDGGYNWTLSTAGMPSNSSVRRIVLDHDNPETLYASLNKNGGLYKSTDKGINWTKINTPDAVKSVNYFHMNKSTGHMYICTGERSTDISEGGVWKSIDNGSTWTRIFIAPSVWQAETSPINPDLLVISCGGQSASLAEDFMNPGVYLSFDAGNSWEKVNNNLGQPNKIVEVMPDPYNESLLWCASWGSGWSKGIIKTEEIKAICSDVTVNAGEEVTLYAHGSIGKELDYIWSAPEEIEDGVAYKHKLSFTAPYVANDSVIKINLGVSNNEGSDNIDVNITIKATGTSLSDTAHQNVTLFPNPAEKFITVKDINMDANYTVLSASGKEMMRSEQSQINISNLDTGYYILKIQSKQGTSHHQFIKR